MPNFKNRCAAMLLTTLAFSAPAMVAHAAETAAAPTTPAATSTMDETAKMNYALGYQLGRDLASTNVRSGLAAEGRRGWPQRREVAAERCRDAVVADGAREAGQ